MSDKISRRAFLKTSALGVIVGGTALSSLNLTKLMASSKFGRFYMDGSDLVVKLSDTKNAALANINGSVLLDDDNILIRTSETQFTAVNLICTHKGCTVELSGGKFICPCHGSEYTISGQVTEGPAKKDLKVYETTYDADKGTVTVKGLKSSTQEG
ncbi:MAG: ubiquinol-cytochrome c reductase iron-sulfur subunit [Ignavibacteriae bacterium]|nr:MAG: ubiquinol-cytochrome c reductase iron-sulfur subunit [Ignavibacteriota bacterium]